MKYKQLFKKFSDKNIDLNITGFMYSQDSDHLLLIVNKECFTILSIKQDDNYRYSITEGEVEDPFNVFYEEDLIELRIMTEEEITARHKKIIDKNKEFMYKEYLRLKAMFEPH